MIYLGGGGSEHDEARLWDEVFQPGARLAVWPYAMPRPQWLATLAWLRQALAPRGPFELVEADADVVVIPGGNTFDLLFAVRDRLAGLTAFLQRGGHVYGGSAGAILLGADIAIAGIIDANDVGLTDTTGADLLSGHVVLPHYAPTRSPSPARGPATTTWPCWRFPRRPAWSSTAPGRAMSDRLPSTSSRRMPLPPMPRAPPSG